MLGRRGMSRERPISTATASPTFFGRTTAACWESGPWTAPRSLASPTFPILAATGTWFRWGVVALVAALADANRRCPSSVRTKWRHGRRVAVDPHSGGKFIGMDALALAL